MRRLVHQAVGFGQVFQLEAGRVVFLFGPGDAVGPQRVGHTHHVQQVPAPTLVLPLARVRVDQVAPEHEARDLVVKPDGVVAHTNGAGLRENLFDLRCKGVFGHTHFQALLRCDAGDQAGLRIGQKVGRGLAIDHQRVADFVQLGVGADGGKLRGAVAAHVGTKGLVVVPEKSVGGHGGKKQVSEARQKQAVLWLQQR